MCRSGQRDVLVPFRIETLLYDVSSEHHTRAVLDDNVGITETFQERGTEGGREGGEIERERERERGGERERERIISERQGILRETLTI